MKSKHFILIPVLFLFLYLGIYTWNQRTGTLDNLSTQVGLEIVGAVLKPADYVALFFSNFWDKYIDLVNVGEENRKLKQEIQELKTKVFQSEENKAEVMRLRSLLSMPLNQEWKALGARVLAGRLGFNSVLETIVLDRGYLTRGLPGTPIATPMGLVGRILRASATTSTALLVVDQKSRIAVISQNSRAPGILTGMGARNSLEMRFVNLNSGIRQGEILVTSGLDAVYPKGMPVARVVEVKPSKYSQFLIVKAEPMVAVDTLEELLLLEKIDMVVGEEYGVDKSPTYPVQRRVDNPNFMGPIQENTFKPVLLEYDMSVFELKNEDSKESQLEESKGNFIGPVKENAFKPILLELDKSASTLKDEGVNKKQFDVDNDISRYTMPKNIFMPSLLDNDINAIEQKNKSLEIIQ